MNNQLRVFEHSQFGKIRITDQNGEAWFVASDVATSLGYERPADAVKAHCKKVNKITQYCESPNRDATSNPPINLNIIPLSDVIRLVMRSKLPDAEKFQDWVCEEVLPSIIKTGKYDMTQVKERPLGEIIDSASKIFRFAGLEGNRLTLACDIVHRSYTGKSALETAGIVLKEPVQEQLYTPTEIGRCLVPEQSARSVNKLIEALGYQFKDNAKKWVMTDKGHSFGEYDATNKRHSDGTPVVQLKWRRGMIDLLQNLLEEGD